MINVKCECGFEFKLGFYTGFMPSRGGVYCVDCGEYIPYAVPQIIPSVKRRTGCILEGNTCSRFED